MREFDNNFTTLTLVLPEPRGDLLRACLALGLQAKNISNTGLYMIRQVMSSYVYDAVLKTNTLKSELRQNQRDVIDHFNRQICLINEKRKAKLPAKIQKAHAAGKDIPELKLIPELMPVMENLAASIFDATVVDNAARNWKNNAGEQVYKRLPGAMAQHVIATLLDNFKGFYGALKRFNLNPKDMTGKPKMPGYMGKTERAVIEIPLAQVHKTLPTQRCQVVPEDYAETIVLPSDVLAAFSSFDVEELIDKACKKRGWAEFQPQHLRIVPTRSGVKMEVVVRVKNAYPAESFLAGLSRKYESTIRVLKKQKERDEWLMLHLKSLSIGHLPRITGIDLGVSNLAAVAYSTGHKAEIHTGGRFDAVVGQFNDRLDSFISSQSSIRARELQGKKNALKEVGEKLPLAEHIELNILLKAVYADDKYKRLAEKKQCWMDNFLHNVSNSIVQRCVAKKIDVIVIGKNKGWKSEISLGKTQNRRFCQVAHARFINFIKYKADHHGIAVVTTDESYTSKTSFVNGDVLENYEETRRLDKSTPRPAKSGKRSQSDRNRFVHKNRIDRWNVVHADVNGAFNIIRKVFDKFTYSLRLTLKFTLFRLSPRLGVVPLQNLGSAGWAGHAHT